MNPDEPPPDDDPIDLNRADELGPKDSGEELPPEDVPRARARPPEPGLPMAIVWCLLLLASLYVPAIVIGVASFFIQAALDPDPRGFMKAEGEGFQKFAAAISNKNRPADQPLPPMPEGISYAFGGGMAAGHVGSLICTVLLLRFGLGRDWTRQVALRRPSVSQAVLAVMVLPGFMVVHDAAHRSLRWAAQDDTNPGADMAAMITPWPVWFAVLILGVGPGVIEEFFCRGFLARGLVARYGFVWGVVLTSALFGGLHLEPLYVLGTFVMGLLLHVTYIFTRSLWVTVGMHFANNGTMALAVTAPDLPGMKELNADAGPFTYAQAFVLSGFGLWALWISRPRILLDPSSPPDDRPLWQPRFPGVEYPPPGSGAVVEHWRPHRYWWPHWVPALLTAVAFVGMVFLLFNPN